MPAINAILPLLCAATLAYAQTDALASGLEAFHKGNYAAAERRFRESRDPRAKTFLALTLAATNRCAEAEPGLEQALQAGEADVRRLTGVGLAQCYLSQDRFEEAAAVVSKLRAWYPSDPDVLYQSARLHMRAWNQTIRQLYDTNPSSFRVNQLSGEILETQGHFVEAAAEYRKAIAKNPAAVNLHFRLGRSLLMSSHSPGVLDAAMKEFEAELALNPGDSVAHYQAAQILLAQQKPHDATERLERALELNPQFAEAMIALGRLRMDEKRNDEAIALLNKAVALVPRSEAAHYSLMLAYRNAGRMDDARREKAELDRLQKPPEGEFSEFLKKLGERPPEK